MHIMHSLFHLMRMFLFSSLHIYFMCFEEYYYYK